MRELASWSVPALVAAAAVAYLVAAGLIRRLPATLLDVPNERSSHRQPVKRGGGLAIVLVVLGGTLLYALLFGRIRPVAPFLAGAALVAGVSLLDDFRSLPTGVRLVAHALAAALALWAYTSHAGLPASLLALAFIWIVGLTNAYNFMDGIDGLAALQAVIAGSAWLVLGIAFGNPEVALIAALAAGGALGFYPHNRAPARIFLGDVGSAFLGYTFAVLPLLLGTHASLGMAAVSIVGVFVFDTGFTFMRRLLRGEPVLRAHRSHLYQRLVSAGQSHASVTRLYGAISALLAAAGLAAMFGGSRWALVALGLVGLAGGSLWLHVRAQERRLPQEARRA